jgi:hypothetical protein
VRGFTVLCTQKLVWGFSMNEFVCFSHLLWVASFSFLELLFDVGA